MCVPRETCGLQLEGTDPVQPTPSPSIIHFGFNRHVFLSLCIHPPSPVTRDVFGEGRARVSCSCGSYPVVFQGNSDLLCAHTTVLPQASLPCCPCFSPYLGTRKFFIVTSSEDKANIHQRSTCVLIKIYLSKKDS